MNVQELRSKLQGRPTDYDYLRTYRAIAAELNHHDQAQFEREMAPFKSYPGREDMVISSGANRTLLKWLDHIDGISSPTTLNLASSPHALPPAPISNNALVELDQWLSSNPSKLSETTYDTLSAHVFAVSDWLVGLGQDFEDIADEFSLFARATSRKRDPLEKALTDTRKRVDELGQIYLELRAPVSTSPRDAAIAQGSSFEQMKAFIDWLVAKKMIDKAEAKILIGLHNDASSAAIGRVRLRNELKKY